MNRFIAPVPVLRCLLLLVSLLAPFASAQYDNWPAARLLSEHARMLQNMDDTTRALNQNIALVEALQEEQAALDQQAAEIETQRQALETDGNVHNAEAERFTAECLDVTLTDPAAAARCNEWSDSLNARSEDLTSRRDSLGNLVEAFNERAASFNDREQARAQEAARLERAYAEFERNVGRIEARLSSLAETSDIAQRCASYEQARTRQRCMQEIFGRESAAGARPYTRRQEL